MIELNSVNWYLLVYWGGYILAVIFFSIFFAGPFGSDLVGTIMSGVFSLIVSVVWPVFVGIFVIGFPIGKLGQASLRYWTQIQAVWARRKVG